MSGSLDEDEIKLMLVDSPAQCSAAIDRVYKRYKRGIMGYFHRFFPGLMPERAADALIATFTDLYSVACSGRFDINKPLEAFLFNAAEKNAIDQLRKQTNRKNTSTDYVEDVEKIGANLKDTKVGQEWRNAVDKGHAEDIQDEFRKFIGTLPPAQKQVAQVMADHFPDYLTYEEVISEINIRTGQRITGVQVKGVLRQIRMKFQEIMKAKGL